MLIVVAVLIAVGAIADTVAFKSTLDLLLREREILSWLMAIGATTMGLVSAARLGIAFALRRRHDTLYTTFAVIAAAAVWLGLGGAMFLVRWLHGVFTAPAFGSVLLPHSQSPILTALFFAGIYLISGACTMFEAEQLYNPEYSAYKRFAKQYRQQVSRTADAEATLDRARSAVDHHDGEFDREDHRRIAALMARKALGAEAANYARVLMAVQMRDPAKTPITETGPIPELPERPQPRALPQAAAPQQTTADRNRDDTS
jgi:hypothetical protein